MNDNRHSWKELIRWSESSYNHFPWRQRRSLYHTLVSELMLQQTTVTVVVQRFTSFMQRFPSWEALRAATLDDVLSAWQGLGYYARARHLYALVQKYPCINSFETDLRLGVKQPGVGPYTKGALLSIALNEPAFAIDANIKRVLTRLYGESFESAYTALLEFFSPRALNEALMDLGRVVCQANIAQCAQCFFQTSCASATLPALIVQKERTKRSVLRLIRLFCINDQGAVLGYQKSAGQWLEGYFEVPTFLVSPEIEQYPALEDGVSFITDKPATTIISQITKYRVINEVYQITPSEMQEFFGERESFYDFYDPNITNWGTVCKRIIRKYSTQHEAECAGA